MNMGVKVTVCVPASNPLGCRPRCVPAGSCAESLSSEDSAHGCPRQQHHPRPTSQASGPRFLHILANTGYCLVFLFLRTAILMGGSGISLRFQFEFPKAVECLFMCVLATGVPSLEKSIEVLLCWVVCRMIFVHQGISCQLSYTAAGDKQTHRPSAISAHCDLQELTLIRQKPSTRNGTRGSGEDLKNLDPKQRKEVSRHELGGIVSV